MVRDLTVGKPGSVLWRFCLPMFGSVIASQKFGAKQYGELKTTV